MSFFRSNRFIFGTKDRILIFFSAVRRFPRMVRDSSGMLAEIESRLVKIDESISSHDRAILYSSVGATLTAWARMEESLVAIVALLLRVHTSKAGLIMYSIINFSVWLALIHDLFALDGTLSPHQKRWNKISERIRAIKDKRDQLAHHPVVQDTSSPLKPSRLNAPQYDTRPKTLRQRPLDASEIGNLGETILGITEDIIALTEAMGATLSTSPQKSG